MTMTLTSSNPFKLANLEDHQLVVAIAEQRDKKALAELYERYRYNLSGFLSRQLYQEKLVGEVYNDVMMMVWQKADSFRGDSKVSTWIYGIAYRLCLSHVRKEMKHTKNANEADFDTMPANAEVADADFQDQRQELRRAIAELNENHRAVIELVYFSGHSLNDVAEIIDKPLNTVKTRLFHARQKLKSLINDQSD